ncbi:ATP-dependent DNA helicase PcrA [bacterium HR41]|nr:ATP-dependent DNA helicase PcrA [bacterium HR41]
MPTAAEPTTADAPALLERLNPEQRQAVEHGEGPLLVLAGAGSGKTRVLVHRIAYLLARGLARPHEILAITFTNKAAGEMRERVAQLVGPDSARAMWVMTFHAACTRMLRVHADKLGFTRSFAIYDEQDSMRLVRACVEELALDPRRYPPRGLRQRISDAKSKLVALAELRAEPERFGGEEPLAVFERYQRRLHQANALDFDDLLVRCVELFERTPAVLDRYRDQFRWILVDEYQDTNRAQYRWLRLLAGERRNVCVVGDDDQSIYRFRGADVRNILDFERDFPDARVIRLERNYRSTTTILEAANAVIANNPERKPKRLRSEIGGGEPVRVVECSDEHEEARFVAAEVERLVEEGASLGEIAVFYRTHAHARTLEHVLRERAIAYRVLGGMRFYDRAEVKDALAYLNLLVNPADEVAFRRVVNVPARGVGERSQARVLTHAQTLGRPVLEVALDPGSVPGLTGRARRGLERFATLIEELRALADSGAGVGDLLAETLERSGYIEELRNEGTFEADARIENLEELVSSARDFERTNANPTAEAFLEQVALFSEQDQLAPGESQLTLMTVHNAKGLEFDTVFVVGLEEGVFPHQRSIDGGEVDEERRLCYVAITRARRLLYLTYARSRQLFGQRDWSLPSRFLGELPADCCRWTTAVGGGAPAFAASTRASGGGGAGSGEIASTASFAPRADGARETQPARSFAVGDDVEHAKFGRGVVIGVGDDGTVLVRFAADGSERRLMVEYAPVRQL